MPCIQHPRGCPENCAIARRGDPELERLIYLAGPRHADWPSRDGRLVEIGKKVSESIDGQREAPFELRRFSYFELQTDALQCIRSGDPTKSVVLKQIERYTALRLGLVYPYDSAAQFIEGELILPSEDQWPPHSKPGNDWTTWDIILNTDNDGVAGYTASGVIALTTISHYDEDALHPSDIAVTMYEKQYKNVGTIAYVFACDARDQQTVEAIRIVLGETPLQPRVLRSFRRHTDEYCRLLGTRTGRVVAYGLLAAFGQNCFHISQIHIYKARLSGQYNMRFDFEPNVKPLSDVPSCANQQTAQWRPVNAKR